MLVVSTCVSVIALAGTGCSSLTKSGRQQAAYAKYVRRSSHRKAQQKVKYGKPQRPPTQPEDDASGPQSTTSDSPQQ